MHSRFLIPAAVAALCTVGGAQAAEQNAAGSDREKLIGAWHMVSMEEQGADGKLTHHSDRTAMLLYTRDGHLSVQVMSPRASAADANPAYSVNGYEASFGSFDIDDKAHTLTHHLQGANVPALVGEDLPRAYQFSNGQLTLRSTRPDEHWSVTWEHY